MENMEGLKKELAQAIEEVNRYESEVRVAETLHNQSLKKINDIVTSNEFSLTVTAISFLPPEIKTALRQVVNKDNVLSYSDLLNEVAHLVTAEVSSVKAWNDSNRC